jgi:hypothetical protein
MQARRAHIRLELNASMFRYQRLGVRLDALAKELDDLTVEIAVARMQRDVPAEIVERRPLRMEIM